VELAAQTLGMLAPEETPGPLRPVAKFPPAKRARLGATVLAAGLEAHPDFREHVAEYAGKVSGDLVDAIRAGLPTPAADPIEVAAVAFLVRSEGWIELIRTAETDILERAERRAEQTLDATIARLEREHATALEAAEKQVQRAEAELREAGEEVRAARKQVRSLTGQLRAAERERDEARELLEEERADAASSAAAAAAEVRRLQSRLADAEKATDAARRSSRSARDNNDARLWLLMETASEAVRGLREELALSPTDFRPADDVAAEHLGDRSDTERRRRAGDLDEILSLPRAHLVVDGYNVTKTGYGDLPLAAQRDRLVLSLGALAARVGLEVTCVFDGSLGPPMNPRVPRGLRVLFSRPGEQADEVIRRLVAAEPEGRVVVVASSDREVAAAARRPGGYAVPSAALLRRLDRA
ncbi:MAG TPA: NYN domain-containing protein, partial [Mycobacteriales bacterium]|nr:NYN domain-containing protein [Mycobacteriales bacterium]